jgi:hypothetical protein
MVLFALPAIASAVGATGAATAATGAGAASVAGAGGKFSMAKWLQSSERGGLVKQFGEKKVAGMESQDPKAYSNAKNAKTMLASIMANLPGKVG